MKKGFTLIELVIVIGILAILAAAVVLVLNPAQLLAQARDSQRLSDLGSVKSAIALYLATAATTSIPVGPYSSYDTNCPWGLTRCTPIAAANVAKVNGSGWVPIVLDNTSGGSPLGALPLDPLNNSTTSQYCFKGNSVNKTFKLTGAIESTKYYPIMANYGGSLGSGIYEVGTDMNL